ncbi:GNAT family N-acetyltransferase [Nocardioides sediminis]|uniref:GNAT family N-acetyltransferase n=1 Tax=Nocardioides sediminis TaxID=433648 RepID=UPI000D31936D|nr:GNAT family N-acetyltransferase [Nocardioides sediminis]
MPRTVITAITEPGQLAAAVDVWAAARAAGGRPPTPGRRARVEASIEARVRDGDVALLATYGEKPAGMALAEPYAEGGVVDPACGHVAMVFVSPGYWGSGIGGRLLRALQSPPAGTAWTRLSVWTRTTNRRALRLYDSSGFLDTGDRSTLHEGEEITRLEWRRPGGAPPPPGARPRR